MYAVLDKNLPTGFSSTKPKGGYFAWISGPENTFDSGEFADWCLEKYKVQVIPSSKCGQVQGVCTTNSMRVSFAFYNREILASCMEKLCSALKEYLQK